MKKVLIFLSVTCCLSIFYSNCSHLKFDSLDDRQPAAVSRDVKDLYQRYVDNNFFDQELSNDDSYEQFMNDFNSSEAGKVNSGDDWIDKFVGSLPERARRHYTFVHRSFSIQSGTPMSPRVILFTPDARTIMTFNSKLDEKGERVAGVTGDESVEVIQWNTKDLAWDFAELKFKDGQIKAEKNPKSCVMCHAGTPKPMLSEHAEHYQGKLKPIFPQYPLWPGFYGSVNDIIGVKGVSEGIMYSEKETRKHIDEFLFADSEELSRLRKALDSDDKYMEVVRNEIDIHQKYFFKFKDSMKKRDRYKHLIPLSRLYTDKGDKIPNILASAPYRASFSKNVGHYVFRPNFFLSSLITFYQAQAVAREIEAFPEYDRMKYSFLASKFNCKGAVGLKSGNLKLTDLNPSFDLIYPNIETQESMNRQYLLAYQYNLVHSAKTDTAHVPLFSWNLEGNEDIASYHYGNVFSDLNEIVLWNLAAGAFESIDVEDGRDGQEARHADFNVKNHFDRNIEEIEIFKRALKGNSGEVSRFSTSQMKFATTGQKYYRQGGTKKRYKGLPVSKHCNQDFVPAAKKELRVLASDDKPLPHENYSIDKRITEIPHVPEEEYFQPIALNGTRQACETCHGYNFMEPQFNLDWHSEDYHETIKIASPWYRNEERGSATLKDKILEVLDPKETLPAPFGNLMPYARRAMDPFSLYCEKILVENAFDSRENKPSFAEKFNCSRIDKVVDGVVQLSKKTGNPLKVVSPQTPENIRNCKCRSLYIRKHSNARKYYHLEN